MSATRILSGYEPASVLSFFEDICAIPHVSGDEKAIADFIEAFAKTRGMTCYRDAVHNVFIKLPATKGHEASPAIMLQGHTLYFQKALPAVFGKREVKTGVPVLALGLQVFNFPQILAAITTLC